MLGDPRSDLIGLLSIVLGPQRATQVVTTIEQTVAVKAREATTAAIRAELPNIQQVVATEAEKASSIWYKRAMWMAGIGGGLAVLGLAVSARRRRRELAGR